MDRGVQQGVRPWVNIENPTAGTNEATILSSVVSAEYCGFESHQTHEVFGNVGEGPLI